MSSLSPVVPTSEADLVRARSDPAFRRKLLERSLEMLLGKMKKQRQTAPATAEGAKQMREAVSLAVRLAELIQTPAGKRGS